LLPLPACGERVGVRGRVRRLRLADKLRLVKTPPHPAPSLPSPACREGREGVDLSPQAGGGKSRGSTRYQEQLRGGTTPPAPPGCTPTAARTAMLGVSSPAPAISAQAAE